MTNLNNVAEIVKQNAVRIAAIGNWPSWIKAEDSLVSRIPAESGTAPGFDAGIACALELIPRDKQSLAATLHAAYTREAVEQVRDEADENMNPDSETCWWLAACSLCEEGQVDAAHFLNQLEAFNVLIKDPVHRMQMAKIALKEMSSTFETSSYGVPFGTKDGCMQGAYVAGYDFAAQYAESYGIFFIGTYLPSLGLEEFPWSDEKDDQGRPKSGPVHGSTQYVKCRDEDEFRKALEVVRRNFLG